MYGLKQPPTSSSSSQLLWQRRFSVAHRRRSSPPGTVSACSVRLSRRAFVGLAMQQPPADAGAGVGSSAGSDANQSTLVGSATPPSSTAAGNSPFPSMPSWVSWMVGAALVAIPIYRRIIRTTETVERTAKIAADVVETVAKATEKVAADAAIAFPNDKKVNAVASRIESIAEVVEKDAAKAESIIQKVEDMESRLDSLVEPIIDQGEAMEKKGTDTRRDPQKN